MAKEILSTEKKLLLPPLTVRTDRALLRWGTFRVEEKLVPAGVQLSFDSVDLEKAIGGIVPDVVLTVQDRKLLVEIRVSHAVDDAKLTKIKELNISAIEYDFSKTDRAIKRKDLAEALTQRYNNWFGQGMWIYHRDVAATQERVNREYLELIALRDADPVPPVQRLWPPPSQVTVLPPVSPQKPTQLKFF